MFDPTIYTSQYLKEKIPQLFDLTSQAETVDDYRLQISNLASQMQYETFSDYEAYS
ncbi:MAG: hypothetical protein M0036_27025 [Desulfobacteraceae bacterium]|nr:hypothetical protein [Desulfobacteraceae bacterium]